MRQFFGTDGMRGTAGEPPLDRNTLYRLGRALVEQLQKKHDSVCVCFGQDTRESCPSIVAALTQGVRDMGGLTVDAGVIPTPGLALLTRQGDFAAGLMISASHNPYHDNGVKVFDADGKKLSDQAELRLEASMAAQPEPASNQRRRGRPNSELASDYVDFLDDCLEQTRLDGVKVVIDAANGAAYQVAPAAFRAAGAEVIMLGNEPDGRNINEGCGSLYPSVMAQAVVEHGADLGFALDGDADRCIAASGRGTVLDGDFVLYYAGRALKRAGQLPNDTVVATVMSNLGLEKALEAEGIRMLRTPVGDRYVLQAMRDGDFGLGGEQSGHLIFMKYAPTGDGTLSALTLARLWKTGAGDLDEALASIPSFPQLLKNIRVKSKPAIEEHPVLAGAVERVRNELGNDGRLVVRYSGTEPKARVMLEGTDSSKVEKLTTELVHIFEQEIGV